MSWLKQLFSRRRLYRDLSEEIREHIDEKTDELVRGGMSRKEAGAAARRAFGNVTLTEEDSRSVWRWSSVEELLADVRYGLRALRHNPMFTAVALLTSMLHPGTTRDAHRSAGGAAIRMNDFRSEEKMCECQGHWIAIGSSTMKTSWRQII